MLVDSARPRRTGYGPKFSASGNDSCIEGTPRLFGPSRDAGDEAAGPGAAHRLAVLSLEMSGEHGADDGEHGALAAAGPAARSRIPNGTWPEYGMQCGLCVSSGLLDALKISPTLTLMPSLRDLSAGVQLRRCRLELRCALLRQVPSNKLDDQKRDRQIGQQ